MTNQKIENQNAKLRELLARKTALYVLMLAIASLVSVPGVGQQVFFHLLGSNEPTVAFLTPATAVNEAIGARHAWPEGLANWTKRRAILLDGVTAPLANAPVLIKLDPTRIDYARARADGFDLRFTDIAGNVLAHQVESWTAGGTSWVWVKLPSLSAFPARNQIFMYYGNPAAPQAQDAAGLWGTDHLQVLHLHGAAGPIAEGATLSAAIGDAATAQNGGSGMTYSDGVFGNAVLLDGVNDQISTGTSASLNFGANAPFSVSTFVKTTDAVGPLVVFRNSGATNHVLGIYIGHNGAITDAGKAIVLVRDGTSSSGYAQIVGPVVNDGQWHLIAVQRNAGNQVELFVDGESYGTASGAASGGAITTDVRRIGTDGVWVSSGAMTADQRYLSGAVEEVRIAGKLLGLDYYRALWAMRNDGLAYFMDEEDFSDGFISLVAQLSVAPLIDFNIPYTVSGTATGGSDHTAVSGTLNFLVGETSKTIRFRIFRDEIVEPNETIIFTLGEGDGYALGANNPHVVTISDEVLSPPNAVDDNVTITSLSSVNIPVLLNDSDSGGDFLTITSFTNPTSGTVQRIADRFVYTPSADFGATDSFTYTISDGRGGTDTATVNLTYQIPFTWTGAGTDANWTTADNWIGAVVPGAMHTAYFNNQCSTSCDPVLPATLNVGGISLNSSYSGTMVQGGSTIQVGSGGFVQRAGTFLGSSLNISSDAGFAVLGGNFRSTSGQLRNKSKAFRVASAVSFDAQNGQIYLECKFEEVCDIEPGTATYYQVVIAGRYSTFDLGGGAMKVVESLLMGDTYGPAYTSQQVNNGEFLVYGDYGIVNNGVRGSSTVRMLGRPTGQTVSGATGKFMPRLKIEAGTQTVTLSGDVGVANHYTYVSGVVVTTGSTLWVHCDYGQTCPFVSGNVDYNNLRLSSHWGNYNLSGSVISVLGQLTIGDTYGSGYLNQQLSNGTFNVRGAISISPYGYRGSAVINSIGGNSTISAGATVGVPQGTFTVNKDSAANTLTFGSNVAFSGAGQAVNVTQGVVQLAGFNLSVGGLLTVGPQGKIICGGGTVSVGSSNILGEISCGSSIGITWTGLAGDGLWSTAGNWTNDTVPGPGDLALFTGICGSNCDVTIDADITVRGIRMLSSYTGMISQDTGRSITVSTAGWVQDGGAFNGSDAPLTIQQSFFLSGGTFRAPTATWTLGRTICGADRTLFEVSGGTFLHGSGLLRIIESRNPTGSCNNTYTVNYVPGLRLFDLELYSQDSGGSWKTISSPGPLVTEPLIVERNFYDYGPANDLSLRVRGNVYLENPNGFSGDFMRVGSGKIILDSGSDQEIHTSGTKVSQVMRVEKVAGSVVPAAGVTNIWLRGLEVIDGIFEAPTGILRLGHKTTTATTMNVLEIASTPDFRTNGGTIQFSLERSGSNHTTATVVVPADFEFDNVRVTNGPPGSGWYSNIASATPLTVNGLFEFLGMRTTATWIAQSDVVIGGNAFGGTGEIRVAGTSNRTITGVATGFAPNLVIESGGGDVNLSGTIVLGHGFTYTSGLIKPGTSHVIFSAANRSNTHSLGGVVLSDVTFNGYTYNHTLTGAMDVTGTLTIAGTSSSPRININGGSLFAHGDVVFSASGATGTTEIHVVGGSGQTVSGVASAYVPSLTINSTGGTVGFSGTLNIQRSYRHLQGNVDAGSSSVVFVGNGGSLTVETLTTVFNNVGFSGYTSTYNIVGSVEANATMTLSSSSSGPAQSINGTLSPRGDLVLSASGAVGNAAIGFAGLTNSTLTRGSIAQLPTGGITVAKTGGASVSLLSDFISSVGGQDLTISSGVLDLSGFELGVPDRLTVAAGSTLRCSGGIFTASAVDEFGTIECPGYSTYPFNWTGATGDGKFSTAGNWQGLVAPSASSVVAFDNSYCGANCDVSLDGPASVRGVILLAGYSGQIQQMVGSPLTVGDRGWRQSGGVFAGSNSAVAIGGRFQLSGGTYTSTSGTLTLNRATTSIAGAAVFNHSNGLVIFQQSMGWEMLSINPGGKNFYDVQFVGDGDVTLASALLVNRNLTVNVASYSASLIGEARVAGDVTVVQHEAADRFNLRLVGSNVQTVTTTGVAGDNSTRLGRLIVDKTGGSISFTGDVLVNGLEHITGSASFVPTSNVVISHYESTTACSNLDIVTPGNIQFPNVGIIGCGPRSINGTLSVNGNLNIDLLFNSAGLRNGKILVAGNFSLVRDENYSSSTEIEMIGGNSATISMAAGHVNPGTLTINKSATAKVSLISNAIVRNGASDVAIVSGELDLAGFNLTVGNSTGTDNSLTIATGATLRRSGGTYTAEAVVNNGLILP